MVARNEHDRAAREWTRRYKQETTFTLIKNVSHRHSANEQYMVARDEHDRTAREWTRRYAS
jgi:hypothetical protein